MNVFLVGGQSRFMDAVINKLNKNGHHVYLLTGQTNAAVSYRHVFERYNFSYESDSIREILASVQPEAVVFFGAYDNNFGWQDARQESVHFTASLVNILSAYSVQEQGRFLYLSSQEVYGDSYNAPITEDTPTSARGFRALALAQGEEICRSYRKRDGVDCVIARLDHLYGAPDPVYYKNDPCAAQVVEMLHTGTIRASSYHTISMLHQNDATEFLYDLLTKASLEHHTYNLSSGQAITLYALAEETAHDRADVTLVDTAIGEKVTRVLSAKRFMDEFHAKVFVGYPDGIRQEVKDIQKRQKAFLNAGSQPAAQPSMGQRISAIFRMLLPYLEALLCLVPAYLLNGFALQSGAFSGLDIYLLYELLIAIVHGQQAAVFAAILASAGYLFQQLQYSAASLNGLMNYNTYIWMVQLFIVGLLVGYLKDQIQIVRADSDDEIRYLKKQLDEIESINNSNVRMKQSFEQQIVNHRDSLGKIYEITAELEQKSPEEVVFYAARVVADLMNTQDVAIYTVANRDYARLFSFTSPAARQMGNSVCYSQLPELDTALQNHRVFINRTLDEHYPLMACGIYTNDSLQLILMLWGLPWKQMNLAEANRLVVVSYLIQNSILRSRNYLNVLQEQRYIKGTSVLQEDAFHQLVVAFVNAKRNGLTECSLLMLPDTDPNDAGAIDKLHHLLRRTDYLGAVGKGIGILLCNTDDSGAEFVANRLQKAGFAIDHTQQKSVVQ